MQAARYRRVSDPSEKIQNQDKDTADMIARLTLELDPRYDCADTGSAWVERPRLPQRDRLLRDAEAGLLKGYTLVVWALDRIARKTDLFEIVKRLKTSGVRLVSCKEPWADTDGPMGELLVFLAGWNAEQESARKSERVKAAFARKRAAGERLGRKPVTIDWRLLEEMRARGFGLRRIARALGCSIGTVHQRLKDRKTVSETLEPLGPRPV